MEISAGMAFRAVKYSYDLVLGHKEAQALEKLKLGELSLDSPEIKYNKNIATSLVTYEALARASSQEKFDLLMEFYLKASTSGVIDEDSDFYHESLGALSNLSVRELMVLYHIDNYQQKVSPNHERDYEPEKYVSEKMALDQDSVLALFHKLLGSGLVIQCARFGGVVRIYCSPDYRKIKHLIVGAYEK
ncbi:TPA: hypothetical protein RQK06_004281 [Vibrio vulnificus]|nr:hypothetical protein [Vibrio vulnificus]